MEMAVYRELMKEGQLRAAVLMIAVLATEVVTGQEQYFITQPRNTYVLRGESANLYCRIGNKVGLAFWEKDSAVFVKENDPKSGFSGSTSWAVFGNASRGEFNLQLIGVSRSDEGRYVCKVTSLRDPRASNLTSSNAALSVLSLPVGEYPMCVMSIRERLAEDDVVEITCAYLNNSTTWPTALTWERISTPSILSNTRQVSEGDYILKRHTVTLTVEDDASSYQCIASAPGMPSRSCTTDILNVRHRPVIELSPMRLLAETGNDARFTCSLITANPRGVAFRWYYRGAAVTVSSSGIDLIETTEETSQILINNLADPTGGVPVVCEATNDVGSTRMEAIISLEEAELIFVASDELVLWLIAFSVLAAVIVLSLFLATVALDCCPCCRTFCNGKRSRRHERSPDRSLNSTWSAAENYGMTPSPAVRRLSDADSTDFYVTRAIKTPRSAVNGVVNTSHHHNTSGESRARSEAAASPPPFYRSQYPLEYHSPSPNFAAPDSRTPSPNARPPPPANYYQSTPRSQERAAADDAIRQDASAHYEQHRSRHDRSRGHFRRGGKPAATNGIRPGDTEIRSSATRNSALSDSGLDFAASSSVDSRSPTPRDERIVYAKIMRTGTDGAARAARSSSPREESDGPGRSVGSPLPTSSTSPVPPRSTLVVPTEGTHRARSQELPVT